MVVIRFSSWFDCRCRPLPFKWASSPRAAGLRDRSCERPKSAYQDARSECGGPAGCESAGGCGSRHICIEVRILHHFPLLVRVVATCEGI
jgi:hypothetical protein